jgi:hypothetical protein
MKALLYGWAFTTLLVEYLANRTLLAGVYGGPTFRSS